MKKIFGQLNITWLKVILFAVITGVYTGLINQVSFLLDTSFRDIAICFECWVLFAVIIAVNCKKPLEAGLKVFVFFLISQPLVYLVETPFVGPSVWSYYHYWFIMTLLTFPGGMLANLVKKKNLLGTLILSCALIILSVEAVSHSFQAMADFPHHLLSALFSLALIICFIIVLIDKVKLRMVAIAITVLAIVSYVGFMLNTNDSVAFSLPEEGEWTCEVKIDDNNSHIEVFGDYFTYTYKRYFVADNEITFTNHTTDKVVVYEVKMNREKNIVDIVEVGMEK